jgi:hypothetical protein
MIALCSAQLALYMIGSKVSTSLCQGAAATHGRLYWIQMKRLS